MLQAIAYRSRAGQDFTDENLEELAAESSASNRLSGVTGVLLFDGISFFQFIEGPAPAVARVFDRIRQSSRHFVKQVVCNGPVENRQFASWHMSVRRVQSPSIARLSEAHWMSQTLTGASIDSGEGMAALVQFWRQSGFEDPSNVVVMPSGKG